MLGLIESATTGLKASHQIEKNRKALDASIGNLSSGSRINKTSDDAAGAAISTKMTAEIRSLQQAKKNAEQAMSFIQTAEGCLQSVQNNITRMKELAVQSASDTIGNRERAFLNVEFKQVIADNEHIIKSSRYGSMHMLDGSLGTLDFYIGAGSTGSVLSMKTDDYVIDPDKISCTADLSTKQGAQQCLSDLEDSIIYISKIRANLGAFQNRLREVLPNLDNDIESKSSANSKIKDTDFAFESVENVRSKMLLESSTAMMAQANQSIGKTAQLIR